MMSASARRARSAASSRRRTWTASPTPGCAIRIFIPPPCAHRLAPRSSPDATIIRKASAWFRSSQPASRATTASSRRTPPLIGEILKENGYSTSWFGKDHNTPTFQASQLGPFDQWPTGMGFEYFYGFVGGDTSQWQPNLFRNTTPDLPVRRQPDVEPHHGDGGRGRRLAEPGQPDRSQQAVLLLLRPRRHACAAPRDAGVDQEDQRHAPVRQAGGMRCASRSSPTRRSSA